MSYPELLLDSQLKWWMVVPISVAMVLVGLLRENLTFVLSSKPRPISFRLNREQYVTFFGTRLQTAKSAI